MTLRYTIRISVEVFLYYFQLPIMTTNLDLLDAIDAELSDSPSEEQKLSLYNRRQKVLAHVTMVMNAYFETFDDATWKASWARKTEDTAVTASSPSIPPQQHELPVRDHRRLIRV